MKISLVGNPNTGKTTLFNTITLMNEHVGNWHGVTVDYKEKQIKFNNKMLTITDLPGLYSLKPYSFEEQVSKKYIIENETKIINICDANNLKKNLFLTLQLLRLGKNLVLCINMAQDLKKNGKVINIELLKQMLGCPVFLIDAQKKQQVKNVLEFTQNYERKNVVVQKIFDYEDEIIETYKQVDIIIERCVKEKKSTIYGYCKLDKIILNKWFCLPIFFIIMGIVFFLTFSSLGNALSDGLTYALNRFVIRPFCLFLEGLTSNQWVLSLFKDAIFAGISTVISFLPQVVLLFFFLGILEDSGYLSRLAFILDDIFGKFGLSGKSAFTLLMGFGCSTTGALTARNLEDKNTKIKTAILSPYMSCSAKIPIYTVVCGAFFLSCKFWVIMGFYALGVIVALMVAIFLEKTVLKSGENQSFILEFPKYRIPSFKRIIKILISNIISFIVRVGSVLLTFSVIIWALQSTNARLEFVGINGVENSILKNIGQFVAPIFVPLGFGNWGAASALICGIIAKEVIVSTMRIINSTDDLSKSLTNPMCAICFTPASAISFLIFSLLYMPCISTIAVFVKEIGKKWTFVAIFIQFVSAYIISFISYKFFNVLFTEGASAILILIAFAILVFSIFFAIKIIKQKKCGTCKNCNKNCFGK